MIRRVQTQIRIRGKLRVRSRENSREMCRDSSQIRIRGWNRRNQYPKHLLKYLRIREKTNLFRMRLYWIFSRRDICIQVK